ncbi:MAG: topoisomerase DNA-binding C4 zinc finger domain-containing protein [Kiritimatiellae bacterium]|nr:topoisomerase DNA-binding C4 zinc finger domain-containing protein [Kiritimatiellia bacterium]
MEMLDVSVKEANQERFEQGKCTWRYALVDGSRIDILDASRGMHGVCPVCGDELIAKKGSVNKWHWAHKNKEVCDAWYEPKGVWHRWWQNQFDKTWQEVVITKPAPNDPTQEIKHIADICMPNGWVIECQYSAMNRETIKAREDFYQKMIWIVCGTRCTRDVEKGKPLFELTFKESIHGISYTILADGDAFSKPWRTAKKPIFFDFYGTFDDPVEGEKLLCLLPEIDGIKGRVIISVSQMELITAIQQNNLESVLGKLRNLLKTLRGQAIQAKKDEELREAERQRKEKEKLEKHKEEEWKKELANPIKFIISLGWVRAYVLLKGEGADKIIKDWAWDGADDSGEVAIHFRNNYTKEDYEREIRWMQQEVKELSYDRGLTFWLLKKFAGCIVGKCSYTRNHNGTFLRRFEFLQTYDFGNRIIPCVPDKQKIWALEEPYFTMVNDRKFESPTIPPCPKCGAPLKRRKNLKDGRFFWGCSKYPNCDYTCSFGANGRWTMVQEGFSEFDRFTSWWCRKKKPFYNPGLY